MWISMRAEGHAVESGVGRRHAGRAGRLAGLRGRVRRLGHRPREQGPGRAAAGDRREVRRSPRRGPAEGHFGLGVPPIVLVFDELAYFSATVGDRKQQNEFTTAVRDLVARGRAAGVIVVAATQRPSADIIPTSLRDLFGYRWAFRCTTPASSDVILGHGWAGRGYSATDIYPGRPRRRLVACCGRHPAAGTGGVPDRRPGPRVGGGGDSAAARPQEAS
jgi:hypothetical protein